MQKVEHIGIAVKSLSESIPLFEKLLNSPCYKIETVASEMVNTAFFQTGETKIELLESQEAKRTHQQYINCKDHIQADGMMGSSFVWSEGIVNGRVVFLHVIVGYNGFIFHFKQVLIIISQTYIGISH